jgi:uncharacterized membrane-anchored protein
MPSAPLPRVDARFWTALCFTSICGINLGDLLPDTFHLAPLVALAVLIAAGAALAFAQARTKQGVEGVFWLAALAIKGASTVLADYAVNDAHLGFAVVCAGLAVLLVAGVAASGGFTRSEQSAGPMFWLILLIAGALGTAAADWSGSSLFSSPKVGFPATAAIETVLIALALLIRHAAGGRVWSLWLAALVICAWGSSMGDIAKFLLSMPVSLIGSAVLLALTVLVWRSPGAATDA